MLTLTQIYKPINIFKKQDTKKQETNKNQKLDILRHG